MGEKKRAKGYRKLTRPECIQFGFLAATSQSGTSRSDVSNDEKRNSKSHETGDTGLDETGNSNSNNRSEKSLELQRKLKKDLDKLKKQRHGEWIPNTRFKKEQMQKRRSKINVVFNYSSIVLTKEMEKVLNRGLKFCIQPLKLDLTQILVDYQRFERTMIWHEFWFGREKDENYKPPIFKAKKNNLPKNHNIPKELKTFLGAVKSEIMDPLNRNKVKCNLPPDEVRALKELVTLIKDTKNSDQAL